MTVIRLAVGDFGTNCYLVADDSGKAAVIDPGDEVDRILRALGERDLTCDAVLLTHAHVDHIGALKALVEAVGAVVYCHSEEIAALTDGVRNLSAVFGVPLDTVETATALEDGDTVTVGDLVFTALHTPGHTPGCCCYRCEDVLFSGDTLFFESIGRTDFPGGDLGAMRASLARLLALEGISRVLPGHDEETTLVHERRYNPYVGY